MIIVLLVIVADDASCAQVDNCQVVAPGQDEEVVLNLHHLVRRALDDVLAHYFAQALLLIVEHLRRDLH